MTDKKRAPISVAIVDDDADMRRTLEAILQRQPATRCIGAFASAEEALQAIPKLNPQLVLMDINLPGMSGVECVRLLSLQMPSLLIVMLTVYDDDDDVFNSLAAGASGYLLKPVRSASLLEAIEEVYTGGAPMSTKIARRVVQAFKKPAPPSSDVSDLTVREREVLDLLAKGYQSKEIATQLVMSYWTVETHVAHIYQKLHVRSRAQAVAKYFGA
ncbi:MAG: response regulator transcription factor [bacterium]